MRYAQLVEGGKTIKQGEIFELAFQLFNAQNVIVVPTVGQVIEIKIANNSGTIYETTASVVDNKIKFKVSENIGYGQMRLEIKITEGTVLIHKYPASGWIILNITPSLDDAGIGGIRAVTAQQMRDEITAIETSVGTALADAVEAKTLSLDTQTQLDAIILESGTSDAELVQARGGEPLLYNRLDNLTSSLKEKANLSDVANISSGTPLFANSIANMTDTTRVYVNTADGFLYLYNTTSLVFEKTTRQYQSTGIANKSVSLGSLSASITSKLAEYVIDYSEIPYQSGFYYYLNGTLSTHASYSVKKIAVIPGDELLISCRAAASNGAFLVMYDVNGVFMGYDRRVIDTGSVSYKDEPVTVPQNCFFLGLTTFTVASNPIIVKKNKVIDIKQSLSLMDQSISYTEFMLNYQEMSYLVGNYSGDTGALSSLTSYSSKKIPVIPGDELLITCRAAASNGAFVVMFNSSNLFMGSVGKFVDTGSKSYVDELFVVPDGCYYLGLTTFTVATNPLIIKTEEMIKHDGQIIKESNDAILKLDNNLGDLVATDLFFDNTQLEERVIALEKHNDFAWKTYDQGYVVFIIDDGRTDLSTVFSIFQEYSVPLSVAIMSNTLNTILADSTTLRTKLQAIELSGGEVLSHSIDGTVFTDTTTDAEAEIKLRNSKKILTEAGFSINGFVKPGGTGALATLAKFEHIVKKYYRYGFSSGSNIPYSTGRGSLNATLDSLKVSVNAAKVNKTRIVFTAHSLDSDINEATLRGILDYINTTTGVTVTTEKYLYDNFGTTKLEKRLTALETI